MDTIWINGDKLWWERISAVAWPWLIVLIHVHIPFFLSRSPKLLWQDGSEHTTGQGTDHGRWCGRDAGCCYTRPCAWWRAHGRFADLKKPSTSICYMRLYELIYVFFVLCVCVSLSQPIPALHQRKWWTAPVWECLPCVHAGWQLAEELLPLLLKEWSGKKDRPTVPFPNFIIAQTFEDDHAWHIFVKLATVVLEFHHIPFCVASQQIHLVHCCRNGRGSCSKDTLSPVI